MIQEILDHREFKNKPPVLVDVGASGNIHAAWQEIAPFSICVGFDADPRETEFIVSENKGFKKFYILRKLIGEKEGTTPFYLTESPYCSSTLEPDMEALAPYHFSPLFKVKKTEHLPMVDLKTALASVHIDYVDWFKSDSQGLDLTIFKGLGDEMISGISAAEFEPGIMDAYKGEDKMQDIMTFMEKHKFWLCDLQIKGPARFSDENLRKHFNKFVREGIPVIHKTMPFWGEMTYLADVPHYRSKRQYLLGCACALVHKQYGFCLELAEKGQSVHQDPLFTEIIQYVVRTIKSKDSLYLRLRSFLRAIKNRIHK